MKKWLVAMAVAVLGAMTAQAEWNTVSEVTAGGDAKELAVNRSIRTVEIECTEGTVIVNTLVVREGGAKTPITVARSFKAGDKQSLDLGSVRQVTGFRISDGGKGRYKVHVK